MDDIQADVRLEMRELEKLGTRVNTCAYAWVNNHPDEVQILYDDGASISDIVDYVLIAHNQEK